MKKEPQHVPRCGSPRCRYCSGNPYPAQSRCRCCTKLAKLDLRKLPKWQVHRQDVNAASNQRIKYEFDWKRREASEMAIVKTAFESGRQSFMCRSALPWTSMPNLDRLTKHANAASCYPTIWRSKDAPRFLPLFAQTPPPAAAASDLHESAVRGCTADKSFEIENANPYVRDSRPYVQITKLSADTQDSQRISKVDRRAVRRLTDLRTCGRISGPRIRCGNPSLRLRSATECSRLLHRCSTQKLTLPEAIRGSHSAKYSIRHKVAEVVRLVISVP